MVWQQFVEDKTVELFFEGNDGRRPSTIWDYRRLLRRFGLDLVVLPRSVLSTAILRGNVVYIPRLRGGATRETLHRFLCHEIAHKALEWEGTEPYACPAEFDDGHRIAQRVERRIACVTED
jgi:hypothetical protein